MKIQNHFSYAGFLQIEITAAAPERNLKKVQEGLEKLNPKKKSLVMLPELWATGFEYEQMNKLSGECEWLLRGLNKLAITYDCLIGGSLPEKIALNDQVSIYNTLFFVGKTGVTGRIRKQHLFSFWQEDDWFVAGDEPKIIETHYGYLGGLVCFDLRFPETARVQCQQGAQLLVVSAQWPLARLEHWRLLLRARAVENQIFIVACNGAGITNGTELAGHSMVIDPNGEIIAEALQKPEAKMVKLDYSIQEEVRGRFSTIAPCLYPFQDNGKIFAVEDSLRVIKRRCRLGQMVVIVRLSKPGLDMKSITFLQKQRRTGDYLVVLLGHKSEDAEKIASLGCVDMVVVNSDNDDALLQLNCNLSVISL